MCFVSVQSGARFFQDGLWYPLVEFISPNPSPRYPEMELVDTLSVSETQANQYEHTRASLLNIWLNKSSWSPRRRQPSFQLWNALEPVKFLLCLLASFR